MAQHKKVLGKETKLKSRTGCFPVKEMYTGAKTTPQNPNIGIYMIFDCTEGASQKHIQAQQGAVRRGA